MSTQPTMNPAQVLQLIHVTSAFGKKAMDEVNGTRKILKAASDMKPVLLQKMLDAGVIAEHQKEAIDKMLDTPAGAMQLLASAVTKIASLSETKTAADRLGEGVDPVKVGMDAGPDGHRDPTKTPFVGQRSSIKTGADVAYERALGFNTAQ